jgi:hypothetical protein
MKILKYKHKAVGWEYYIMYGSNVFNTWHSSKGGWVVAYYYSPIPSSAEQVSALEFLVVIGHIAEEVCEMRRKSQKVVCYE